MRMKALFHWWLLLFVVLAFGLTFGLSWYLHRKEARENALQLLDLNLEDVAGRVKRAEGNLQTISELSAASAIAKTRAFALLIKEKPSILQDSEELKLIRRKLDVDELHVSDKTGKLIASLVHDSYHGKDNYLGFNLAKEEQSRVFMKAVTDPGFEFVQKPQFNGAEGKMFQYTGVARPDEPGVVQVGYSPERLRKAQQLADVKTIESDTRIGINGKLTITENTEHPADYKRVFYTREGLCKSIVCGNYLLTAMLPWKEVHTKDRTFIIVLFIGNIIVFALIFALVAGLLQKVVIKEISDVTQSLDELSKGNFDKKIEGKRSSEMSALVESINKAVSALKKNAAPVRVETGADITAKLKNSLRPANIPENVNYKFTSDIFTATEVGGNMCDLFTIDNGRIALFFANTAETGVPQGLHMIKARNLLKKALAKNSPEKALKLVNEELFRSGKNIPLKAFLGVFNLYSGVLMTYNANYIDPIVKSKNGNVSFVKGPFIPMLGACSDTSFIPMPLQLNAGDELYFYSREILEVQNAQGEKYSRERLQNMISSSGNDAQKIVDSIRQDVMKFTGETSCNADIAVAVLQYTPKVSSEE